MLQIFHFRFRINRFATRAINYSTASQRPFFKRTTTRLGWSAIALLRTAVLLTGILGPLTGCGKVADTLRNWGERQRRSSLRELDYEEVQQWQKDLQISEQQARELNKNIELLVQESALQGNLSWKIARAYTAAGRYSMAEFHYKNALVNQLAKDVGRSGEEVNFFDAALPFYQNALKNSKIDHRLLFDAGLCYANASRSLGWEADRYQTAVFIFERLLKMDPENPKPYYQLALLYSQTGDENFRDQARAMELLNQLLQKKPNDIPARFARAHILAQTGDFAGARTEYVEIADRVKTLHQSGILSGSHQFDKSFSQAQKNIEEIDHCINADRECTILSGE